MKSKRILTSLILGLCSTLILLCLLNGGLTTPVYADNYDVSNTNATGAGSLRQAILDANSNPGHDTINFSANVSGTIVLTDALPAITGSLTIAGPGADLLAVSGANAYRVFEISAGSAVTITELTIRDGYIYKGNGGGIWNAGALHLDKARVISNTAFSNDGSDIYGGGVYVGGSGATLTVSGGEISRNLTDSDDSTHGGGVCIFDGSATLSGTQVLSNSASSGHNGYGGGVYVTGSGATLTVNKGEISNNSASGSNYSYGGGVYVSSGSATLNGAQVLSNSADAAGGVYVSSGSATLNVSEGAISDNSANDYGGGVLSGGSVTLSGTQVISNSAGYDGGGVYVGSGSATLSGTQVFSNSAGSGGGIYIGSGNATLSGTQVFSNSAGTHGGGIYIGSGNATLSGTQVFSNSAGTHGGGVYVTGSGTTLTVSGGEISRNAADYSGGGVYVNSGSATLSGTQVISNSADYGGGVYVGAGNATLTGTQILSNSAGWSGGGVYVTGSSATLDVSGGEINGNAADTGGGVYVILGSATLTGTQILSNSAGWSGGGMFLNYANVTLTGTQAINNSSGSDGGGICVIGGSVTLSGTQVTDNSANDDGGGVYVHNNDTTLGVSGGGISRNLAGDAGGGVYVHSGSAMLTETQVISNSADTGYGGGVYVESGSATLSGARVLGNVAAGGGGLYLGSSGAIIAANGCLVYNSDAAVFHTGSGSLNTDDNWWGAADGPSGVQSGSGDSIGWNVVNNSFKTVAPAGCPTHIPNLSIVKSVTPTLAAPLETVTYTLAFSNVGKGIATGVVITDIIPVSVTVQSVISSGDMAITQTQPGAVFETAPILAGRGGVITISGVLSQLLPDSDSFTNTAVITAAADSDAGNNRGAVSVDIIAVTNNRAAGPGSLRQAILNANVRPGYDVINFAPHVLGSIVLTASLPAITAPVTIAGPGADLLAVSGNNAYRVFEISAGAVVTITGLTIRDGYVSGIGNNGGGIWSAGDLHLDSTRVISNTAYDENGGGLYVWDGSATLKGTHIVSNSARYGGGVYVWGNSATLSVSGGEISRNTAIGSHPSFAASGGGVYVSNGSATLNGTQVINNSANVGHGGGVYVNSGSATLTGTQVISNSAGYSGGGLYVYDGSATLTGTQVLSNTAGDGGGGVYVYSGGIEDSATLDVSGGEISYNRAVNAPGGGVYVELSSATLSGTLVFSNSAAAGGGMFVSNGGAMLTGTQMTGNSASDGGGGMYIASSSATLNGGEISRNTADAGGGMFVVFGHATLSGTPVFSNAAGYGGGVYLQSAVWWDWGTTLNVSGGEISHNSVITDGGGVYVTGGDAMLTGTLVFSNSANNGGGLYLNWGSATLTGTQVISNSASNWGDGDGGGVYVYADTARLNVSGGEISRNQADDEGGGLYLLDGSAALTGTQVLSNSADSDGGGLYIRDGSAALNGVLAAGNKAVWGRGGGLFLNDGRAALSGTQVISNLADVNGGGLYITGPDAELDVNGGAISRNSASTDGGGLLLFEGRAILTETQITGNDAAWGGGIFVQSGSAVLNKAQLSGNLAVSGGGGYVFSDTASLDVNGGEIKDNRAEDDGGGLYLEYGIAALNGTRVVSNAAGWGGSGIFIEFGYATLSETQVLSNTAGENGGGVYLREYTAELDAQGGEISHNSVITDGGGVYIYNGLAVLSGTQVISNSASVYGGGVYVYSNTATLAVIGGEISRNSAGNGGGVGVRYGGATLSGTQVTGNSAGNGGGVYVGAGSATLTGTQVLGNSASVYGGGVYVWGAPAALNVSGGAISRNSAGLWGGGILLGPTNATLSGTQILSNSADYGGGVYIFQSGAKLALSGGEISRNAATTDGGGVYVYQGSATLTETQILGNTAADDGGGMYVEAGSTTLTGTRVLGNAAANGGGFYRSGGTGSFTVNNGCIVYNSDTAVDGSSVNAQDNWWGAADGPSGVGPGSGDSVSLNVNYANFKTDAPVGCPTHIPDVSIVKSVTPTIAAPGASVTYTLAFSNAAKGIAAGVIITDIVPVSVTNVSVVSSGVSITQTASGYVWDVQDLGPAQGGVITISGVLSYPLAAGIFTNTAVISTTALDSNANNNRSAAIVTVSNIAPVAVDDAYATPYEAVLTIDAPGVLLNDSDPNGDSLTAALESGVSNGSLTLNADGSFVYTPDAGFNGNDSFTYRANDGLLNSNIATVTLTVNESSAPLTYTLSINIVGSGAVNLDPTGSQGSGSANFASVYTAGITVTLSAMPDNGWTFDGWSGDGTAVFPLWKVLMDGNKVVTATFTEEADLPTIYLPLVMR